MTDLMLLLFLFKLGSASLQKGNLIQKRNVKGFKKGYVTVYDQLLSECSKFIFVRASR